MFQIHFSLNTNPECFDMSLIHSMYLLMERKNTTDLLKRCKQPTYVHEFRELESNQCLLYLNILTCYQPNRCLTHSVYQKSTHRDKSEISNILPFPKDKLNHLSPKAIYKIIPSCGAVYIDETQI